MEKSNTMEWNRGTGQAPAAGQPAGHSGVSKAKRSLMGMRAASVGLLVSIAILALALIGYVAFGTPASSSAGKFVDKSKMQAVFLNGGQVYFGRINNLNDTFMRVSDIYYLRVNQTVQPNGETAQNQDISLVKLGCELHGPQDSMVINQDQVIFWENLKDDGQVAKAVKTYKEQNPQGQKCDTAASGTGTGTGTSTGTQQTTTGTGTGTTTGTGTGTTGTGNTGTTGTTRR